MNVVSPKRAYRQSARATAAEATRERILDAFAVQLRERWFDEIRLEDVARDADVTVQTIIRRFGNKEGLIDATCRKMEIEVGGRREVASGDVAGAVAGLIEDYETVGDLVIRVLAQEDRYAPVRTMTDFGRASHRQWIAQAFAPWIERKTQSERRATIDALVVAADIYVWKLVRRDMGRPVSAYRAMLETLLAAAVDVPRTRLFNPSPSGVMT
jgi:AcrR family transcriptional regulator